MSYYWFGAKSDVYLYRQYEGYFVCCACFLPVERDPRFKTAAEALEHLNVHLAAGHQVPSYAIERLTNEIAASPASVEPGGER